jgi:2-polyprenyl-3-methyl-5-hydroxy-6-metoxy-1,4-benzoquinol methylase
MLLTKDEVVELTGLQGYRIVNHTLRKSLLVDLISRHFSKGAALADIGCAAGDLTIELQALGFQMTGVDYEPQRLAKASAVAEKRGLNVRFIMEDLRNVVHSEYFDGLIMGEVLEHFTEPKAILDEHLVFLKPGGKIVITVPNVASLRARLKLLVFGEFADHNPEHKYYFTRRRFQEHFQGSRIEILEMFTFLVELTLSSNESLARLERSVLSPLRRLSPWCGSHLVAVVRKA